MIKTDEKKGFEVNKICNYGFVFILSLYILILYIDIKKKKKKRKEPSWVSLIKSKFEPRTWNLDIG